MSIKHEYDLIPASNRKSFYGKAKVIIDETGAEYLRSYNTVVLKRSAAGELFRCWYGLNGNPAGQHSATTSRHITAFCGLNRKQYEALQYIEIENF